MSAIPQQLFANQKASLDALLAVQTTAFSGFEKLVDLHLKVARAAFEEASQKAQEAIELKDVQEAVAFTSGLSQPTAEKALAYSKHVYDIVSGVQTELAKLTEVQIAENQKNLSDAVEQLTKNAPTGSESAVAMLKSSLATATSAYDSLSKAAKQAAEVAESNITAATNATFQAAETAKAAAANGGRPAARRAASA